jgi:hypothetical protein
MNKLVDAFSRFSGRYLNKYRDRMLPSHFKAIGDFNQCRTETYGTFAQACMSCGLLEESHGACRNRACPKCNSTGTSEWIEKAKARLPNIPYYHMVFTVPSEMNEIGRRNQKVFYDKLMAAVGETLSAFGESEKWVQGRIGFMTFLHTWDSKLNFHPHVHVLLMGGFLDSVGTWRGVNRKEVFPARALSTRFRTVFLKSLREELGENIPSNFWKLAWVVYQKKTLPGTRAVIEYLGKYVKRIGIGASRLLRVDKKGVVLKYRHRLGRDSHEFRPMHLSGEEFMRRYLQHVLPKGFVRIRYLGLLHSRHEETLAKLRSAYAEEPEKKEEGKKERTCRECDGTVVEVKREMPTWLKRRRRRGWKFYIYKGMKRSWGENDGTSPSNNRLEPSVRGRHVFRLRESRAGTPPGAGLPASPCGPCSRLSRTLYGPCSGRLEKRQAHEKCERQKSPSPSNRTHPKRVKRRLGREASGKKCEKQKVAYHQQQDAPRSWVMAKFGFRKLSWLSDE